MEEAVAHRVAQERLHQRARERGRSNPLASSAARSVSGVPRHPFERQHVRPSGPSRPPARGTRRSSRVFSAISEIAAASRRKSISIVTLRRSVSTASTIRRRRASADVPLGVAGGEELRREVGFQPLLDARPQHLDGDRRAVRRPSRPRRDAPGRSRRPRPRGPKLDEHLAHRPAERGLHRRLRLGLRERRHLVLQAFEVARERRAHHVGTRGEELTELHVARAEPGERRRQPHRRAGAGRPLDQRARAAAPAAPAPAADADRPIASTPSRANTKPARASADQMDEGRDHALTAASRNAARRCRRSSRDTKRGESRRPRSSSANTCGRGKRRIELDQVAVRVRHRPPPCGRASESR